MDPEITQPPIEERRKNFLENNYLSSEYLVPPDVDTVLAEVAEELAKKFSEFRFITLVGGRSNGSYLLRSLEKPNPPSDVGFYISGHETTEDRVQEMAAIVQQRLAVHGMRSDGVLNGKRMDNYFNLDDIAGHIEKGDVDLLVLPFR